MSVADSGLTHARRLFFGIPKNFYYADGVLNMLMIDLFIIEHSDGQYSLNDA